MLLDICLGHARLNHRLKSVVKETITWCWYG